MSAATPSQPNESGTGFPALRDVGGYLLQPRDAGYVGVTPDNLRAMAARACPLGFPSAVDWQLCRDELRAALQADGLGDADVRLKGSSAEIFSRNPNKAFPQSGAECRAHAVANGLDGAVAEAQWNASPYATASTLPNQYFWDCRQRLGIDRAPSDYDVQIASDTLVNKIHGVFPPGTRRARSVISRDGGHYRDAVLRQVFPDLAAWSERWQSRLGRRVNMAGYPAAGPANPISHFHDEDWVIIP